MHQNASLKAEKLWTSGHIRDGHKLPLTNCNLLTVACSHVKSHCLAKYRRNVCLILGFSRVLRTEVHLTTNIDAPCHFLSSPWHYLQCMKINDNIVLHIIDSLLLLTSVRREWCSAVSMCSPLYIKGTIPTNLLALG